MITTQIRDTMKPKTFRTIFLSNMPIDKNSYLYQQVLMTNIILYLAGSVFFVFFLVHLFVIGNYTLGIAEGIFTLPIVYIWYRLRIKHTIDVASTFAVLTIIFAAIATIFVAKAQSFSILWSFTLPFVTFSLKGYKEGMKFLFIFYAIVMPYIYTTVGVTLSTIEFMRFSAVNVVVILIAFFFAKIVREAYTLLHENHEKLSHSNTQLQSSIRYATNIQKSFLAPWEAFSKEFGESFVIWQPKDIVSGDLYLYGKSDKGILIGVADCTGHGVSGGFITMLVGSSFRRLSHSVISDNPAMILRELNSEIRSQLNQNHHNALSDDGLDMGLCYIDSTREYLTFAGAKIDLVYIEDGEVVTIKSNKQSLGYKRSRIDYEYTNHTLSLKDQSFYLYSDGITDQIGGTQRFLYGNKRFKKFLFSIHHQPMQKQKRLILSEINRYQGEEMRRDDITLVGFRFTN